MTATFAYSDRYEPPAPVIPVVAGHPADSTPAMFLQGLLDTGADMTVVPAWLPTTLGLRAVDAIDVTTPTGSQRSPVFLARFRIATHDATLHVLALGAETLVGRDLLAAWRVTLDGPSAVLEIA